MTKEDKLNKLCRAIVSEVNNHGYGDFFARDYNTSFTIDIGLTIEEIRLAADLINYEPSKREKEKIQEAIEDRGYVEYLDSDI